MYILWHKHLQAGFGVMGSKIVLTAKFLLKIGLKTIGK